MCIAPHCSGTVGFECSQLSEQLSESCRSRLSCARSSLYALVLPLRCRLAVFWCLPSTIYSSTQSTQRNPPGPPTPADDSRAATVRGGSTLERGNQRYYYGVDELFNYQHVAKHVCSEAPFLAMEMLEGFLARTGRALCGVGACVWPQGLGFRGWGGRVVEWWGGRVVGW